MARQTAQAAPLQGLKQAIQAGNPQPCYIFWGRKPTCCSMPGAASKKLTDPLTEEFNYHRFSTETFFHGCALRQRGEPAHDGGLPLIRWTMWTCLSWERRTGSGSLPSWGICLLLLPGICLWRVGGLAGPAAEEALEAISQNATVVEFPSKASGI